MEIVKALLLLGYAYPCACCKKLWENYNNQIIGCTAKTKNLVCGGPIAGMAFPLYEGPLTRESIANSCFRCGKSANKIFETPTGFYGSCKEHLQLIIPQCINALKVDDTDAQNYSIFKKQKS